MVDFKTPDGRSPPTEEESRVFYVRILIQALLAEHKGTGSVGLEEVIREQVQIAKMADLQNGLGSMFGIPKREVISPEQVPDHLAHMVNEGTLTPRACFRNCGNSECQNTVYDLTDVGRYLAMESFGIEGRSVPVTGAGLN